MRIRNATINDGDVNAGAVHTGEATDRSANLRGAGRIFQVTVSRDRAIRADVSDAAIGGQLANRGARRFDQHEAQAAQPVTDAPAKGRQLCIHRGARSGVAHLDDEALLFIIGHIRRRQRDAVDEVAV